MYGRPQASRCHRATTPSARLTGTRLDNVSLLLPTPLWAANCLLAVLVCPPLFMQACWRLFFKASLSVSKWRDAEPAAKPSWVRRLVTPTFSFPSMDVDVSSSEEKNEGQGKLVASASGLNYVDEGLFCWIRSYFFFLSYLILLILYS